jgi:hypothetical protein
VEHVEAMHLPGVGLVRQDSEAPNVVAAADLEHMAADVACRVRRVAGVAAEEVLNVIAIDR